MIISTSAMDIKPGIAPSSAPTTRRMDGTMVSSRITRNTRSARSTASWPVAGSRAMVTTTKSNTLQGSRQKARR